VKEHLGRHFTDFLTHKFCIPNQPGTTAKINSHLRQAIIHWQQKTISFDSFFASQCIYESFAKCNGHIFNGVVFINMQITFYLDSYIHISMPGNLFQHMVEKAQTSRNRAFAGSIQVEFNFDIGFGCFSDNLCFSWFRFQQLINISPVCCVQISIFTGFGSHVDGFTTQVLGQLHIR